MTSEQVNRILAEYEGWEKLRYENLPDKMYKIINGQQHGKPISHFEYTADWDEFHKVWVRAAKDEVLLDKMKEMLPLILWNDTPLPAATELANIIKRKI